MVHYLNLLYYIIGYVKIELRGIGMEKFLNMAVNQGVLFWDVKRKKDSIQLKTTLKDFSELRKIVKKTDCHFSVIVKKGLPFYFKKMNKRKGLIFGCILFVAIMYYLSSFIWFIQVEGNQTVASEKILDMTEKHGLRPGIKKDEIDILALAKAITAEDDKLVWAGIEIRGTRALVEVVEREEEEENFQGYGDIVALEKGEIKKIIALSGHPLVDVGDEVRRDEILIAGRIVPTKIEQEQPYIDYEDLQEYSRVEAKGFVYGTMVFDNKVEVLLERKVERRTSNEYVRRGIKIGDRTIYLDLQDVPYLEYDVEKIETQRITEGFRAPFNLVKKVYYETEEMIKKLSKEEAREEARELLLEELEKQIPPNSKVIDIDFKEAEIENNKLRKELEMKIEGNMGKLKSF